MGGTSPDKSEIDLSEGEGDVSVNTYYQETNPLLIDAVLRELVQYLELEDLKALRLVHTSWNRAMTPRLRKCCRVIVRPVGMEEWEELKLLAQSQNWPLERPQHVFDGSRAHKDLNEALTAFNETFANGLKLFEQVPFGEFKLIDFPFKMDLGKHFFALCGKHITALDIRVNRKAGKLPPAEAFGKDFLPNLLTYKAPLVKKLIIFPFPGMNSTKFIKTLPHLESIHFKEWALRDHQYTNTFLQSFFDKTIRLQEIIISIGHENSKSVQNILVATATSGRFSNITKLHIAYLRLRHLEVLIDLASKKKGRLRLRNFGVEDVADDVPTYLFEQFVRTQSVNLQEMYCRRFKGAGQYGRFAFPVMTGLQKLDCELNARQMEPLRCNTKFPNLTSLVLFGTCCQVFTFDRAFCDPKISECLTTLHFRPGLIVKGSILAMAEHFPQLKSLTMSVVLGADLKQLLQSRWSETLENLELYFSLAIKNIDSYLIGMTPEKCMILKGFLQVLSRSELLKRIAKELEKKENVLEELQDWPLFFGESSLRNFKKLRILHLEYNGFLTRQNLGSPDEKAIHERSDANSVDNDANGREGRYVPGQDLVRAELDDDDGELSLGEESYLPGDLTGYFSLAQMKSLRRISVPECLFSKECCEVLIENLGLVGWKFGFEASEIIPPKN